MAGLCEGGNEPLGSLKAICNYNGWEAHRANHTIPPFWLDDRLPLLWHVDMRPAVGCKCAPTYNDVIPHPLSSHEYTHIDFTVLAAITSNCDYLLMKSGVLVEPDRKQGIEAFSEVRRHFHSHSWWDCRDFFTNRRLQFVQCMWLLAPSNGTKERTRRARDLTTSDNLSAIACLRADR
ncbi:hypothetical protein ANN_13240 [Periplaneta americana]|uniref:Uncharacterized protein n=1 Tax=Periplaneta americana TaxID=6978 RepID=A0ABQ8TIV3_PERAM|nr:hypothetical protein ANN_13240 [Periplaneta americana]